MSWKIILVTYKLRKQALHWLCCSNNSALKMKYLVIGISGPTCSGKTSVSKKVHEHFKDSVLINQDSYFLPEDDKRHTLVSELNHFNWEIMSSMDMPQMYEDVKQTINSFNQENGVDRKILILEGFLLYNYKPIADLCDKKYFLHISKEVCWNRRKNRVYNPPDVPGYFDKVVWPEYLKHRLEIMNNEKLESEIQFLDGTESIDELSKIIIKDVTTLFYKQ
ncbi:nicotinamide riboside kinase 1 [Trichogramma pretiosum]|uniref:nicotinamide riboside kinase 1 n=1 Tax=Trichogramma pretiosum TaxID=7493 RepID=UPI0006C985EF|nr:nicotinamide riboside kinase 1 [Trichogramma pretiosum]